MAAKKDYTSTDPDAGYYIRQGDHRDPDLTPSPPGRNGRRRRTKDKLLWGYDAALVVARNPHHDPEPMPNGCGDPTAIPALTLGYILDKPGSYSDPDNWRIPLRVFGYRPTYDYRIDQLARVEARSKYALASKGKPNADGKQRYMCPATAGRLQCPFKPASLGTDLRLLLVDPMPSPVGPPKICEQTAITVNLEDGAKHWQPRAYGSPEWQKIYGRLRNAVEGMNGYAKTDAHEGIEHAGNRRVRGIAAQTLLLAFQLAHANERKINAWLATLPGPDERPHRRARQKKPKPLGTWTPTGHIDPPAGRSPSPHHKKKSAKGTAAPKFSAVTEHINQNGPRACRSGAVSTL